MFMSVMYETLCEKMDSELRSKQTKNNYDTIMIQNCNSNKKQFIYENTKP